RPGLPPRAHTRALLAAGAAAVIALAGWMAWENRAALQPFLHGGGPRPAQKQWVLVAELDAPSEDRELATATRDLVMAALDQSPVVASVPLGQIRTALELVGKPDTTRVDARLARELAYRSSVRAVVEGRISRLGDGYSIVLRVTDAEDPKVVL